MWESCKTIIIEFTITQDVEIHIGSEVKSILGDKVGSASGWSSPLFQDVEICRTMQAFCRVWIHYIFREGNLCADT